MKYRRLLLGGFLAMGLAVTTASGALAEQIVAVNSPVESVGGQATKVTDAGQNAADTSQATVNSSVNTDTTQSAAGNTQTDTAQNTEASAAKPDPASITPTATGISIYISKRQSKLTLMQNKQAIGVWDAKLGRQSATGDKVQEGDEITPSGSFDVCTRNDKSKYYLALGLSYPNIEDAERGLSTGLITQEQYQAIVDANKAGVTPPWDTPLGGAIEIHGNQGDRGTAGCIAMTNDVMDILWSYCAVGVPVTIGP